MKKIFLLLIICCFNASAENSYQSALQAFKKENTKSPFSEAEQKILKSAAEKLAKKLPKPGLKVGQKAPLFTLKNMFGRPISLADKLKKGPVILVFYRGAWCPFCNLHLRTLHKHKETFADYDAQLLFVTPQQPIKSLMHMKEKGFNFEVLSDSESKVMKQYNLYFKMDPKLTKVYKDNGLDVESFNGEGRTELPVPGTFVIDQQGVIQAMQADTDYTQRMEPAAIIKTLEELSCDSQ